MKTLLLIFFCFCLKFAAAQSMGNSGYDRSANNHNRSFPNWGNGFPSDSSFILETNVLMNVPADKYVAIFGMSQSHEKLNTAYQLLENRRKGFFKELSKLKIDTNTVHIDFISQVPTFGFVQEKRLFSDTYNEVPTGFEIQQNLHIQIPDERMLRDLMKAAATWEIYDFIKLEYFVSNTKAVNDTLRKASLDLVNNKLLLLKTKGMKINIKYQIFSENMQATYPENRYASYTAYQSEEQVRSSKRSNTNFARKSSTQFYDKTPYDGYELIINPVVVSPVVQFSYCLKMKFTLTKQ